MSEILKGRSQIMGKSKLQNLNMSRSSDKSEEREASDSSDLILKAYKFTPEVYQTLLDITDKVNELTKRPVTQVKVMHAIVMIASRHDPKEIKDAIIEAFY